MTTYDVSFVKSGNEKHTLHVGVNFISTFIVQLGKNLL